MCVDVYVCMYICIYVCIYICMCVCIYIYIYIYYIEVLGLHLAQASGGHAELATDAADIGVTTNQGSYVYIYMFICL